MNKLFAFNVARTIAHNNEEVTTDDGHYSAEDQAWVGRQDVRASVCSFNWLGQYTVRLSGEDATSVFCYET